VHVTGGSLAVSASPRVRDRLRTAPDGPCPVLHAGRHAVYLDLDGWCLGVVGRDAAAVPNALRLAGPDLAGLEGADASVVRGVLHLDGTALHVGRLVDTGVPPLDVRRAGRPVTPPPAPEELAALTRECGLSLVSHRPLGPEDVARLVGRGGGLTPLGDDVLCGWLATHRAAGHATPGVDAAVRSLLGRTTLLSATLLECATHGEVLPQFAGWLAALGTPDERHRATALAAVGHTSGAGLLHGAVLALTELDPANGAAA